MVQEALEVANALVEPPKAPEVVAKAKVRLVPRMETSDQTGVAPI